MKRRSRSRGRIHTAIIGIPLLICAGIAVLVFAKEDEPEYPYTIVLSGDESISDESRQSTVEQKELFSDDELAYSVLVNWDNPIDESVSIDLVKVSAVVDERYAQCDEAKRCVQAAGEALNEMLKAGSLAGHGKFIINSAYRSVQEQSAIWGQKIEETPDYGKDPYQNPVRAMPPDKSEHSTGLAFDILTEEHPFANKWFGTFEDGMWLADNCHRFGFILRYPKEKTHITGVMYEPWHFRYVGEGVASYMKENDLCLEEFMREIDGY